METTNAAGYRVRLTEAAGWPLRITSYSLGAVWIAVADNLDPGATLARCRGESREVAEADALRLACERLAATRLRG
jgi:hypothetical protein